MTLSRQQCRARCGCTLVIAVLPTHASIGAAALLLVARLFQGLSVGGEHGTSATYMSEVAVATGIVRAADVFLTDGACRS